MYFGCSDASRLYSPARDGPPPPRHCVYRRSTTGIHISQLAYHTKGPATHATYANGVCCRIGHILPDCAADCWPHGARPQENTRAQRVYAVLYMTSRGSLSHPVQPRSTPGAGYPLALCTAVDPARHQHGSDRRTGHAQVGACLALRALPHSRMEKRRQKLQHIPYSPTEASIFGW